MRWKYLSDQFKSFFILLLFVFLSTACERFVGTSISEKDAATPTNERQSFHDGEPPVEIEHREEVSADQNEKKQNDKCLKSEENANNDLDEIDCLNSPNIEEKSSTKLSDQ